jgi:hypothetical protein
MIDEFLKKINCTIACISKCPIFAIRSTDYLAVLQNSTFLKLNVIAYNRTLNVATIFNNDMVHHNRVDNL